MLKNKYASKKYRHNREIVINKYDYKCGMCFQSISDFEVHHIDRNLKNNDINNLIPLCKSCHQMIHKCNIK